MDPHWRPKLLGLLQNWRRMIMQLHTGSLINITSDLREWESRSIGRSTDQTKLLSVNWKQFPRSLNLRLVLLCDLSSFGLVALSPHAPAPRWGDGDSSVQARVHPQRQPFSANLQTLLHLLGSDFRWQNLIQSWQARRTRWSKGWVLS